MIPRTSFGCFLLLLAASDARSAGKAREHWAFRPVQRPAVPAVKDKAWVRNPVDAFVLVRLEAAGLRPNAPADKRTLLRRVTLDLIGLPPTPEEQRAFLADPSPQAFARVVDRLLASPHYGERWARHWLDVARYAETNGYERDGLKPHAWRYRDYVIDAFNSDLPYDRFVMEQIAGDELPGSDARTQTAATFLRLGTWDDEPADEAVDRYDQLDDVLGVTASTFLAQTIRCARCHDHKFEPFSQKDYYRLLAVFAPLKRPQKERADLDRLVGTEEELSAYARARARHDSAAAECRRRLEKLAAATLEQRLLAEPLRRRLAELARALPAEPPRAYVWYEEGPKAPATRILRRGNPDLPGRAVTPGLPAVLVDRQPDPPKPLAHSTGRRLWLARWVASPDNPLTARVMVNRVWQYHFGRGIVGTPGDFGTQGEMPSHPELLDWLASEFVAKGWSLKHLHRLIVLSATYQTSSALEGADGERKLALFGRWRMRRVEAEVMRDGVLAVSGQLNPRVGGPSVYPPLPRAVLATQSRPGEGWGKSDARQSARRSIYVFSKRSLAPPELELLDSPDTTSPCEQRRPSTTAPQALTFLNGQFLNEQAAHFADRLCREAGDQPAARVRRAFELALCRPPRPAEMRAVLKFLAKQERQIAADARASGRSAPDARRGALAAFCLVLLNGNEFAYPG